MKITLIEKNFIIQEIKQKATDIINSYFAKVLEPPTLERLTLDYESLLFRLQYMKFLTDHKVVLSSDNDHQSNIALYFKVIGYNEYTELVLNVTW